MENKFAFGASSIHYRKIGSGIPLILIHGFGEDSTIWDRLIPLIENATLYIPQLPGTEQSAMIANGSMEAYADSIATLIEHEAIQNPVVIGHSMGGYITLALVEKYPGLVRSFGLFHSSAVADNDEKKESRRKTIDFIKEHGSRIYLETALPNYFKDEKKHRHEIDRLIEQNAGFAPEALVQYLEAMIQRPDRKAIVKNAEVPVLFIIGEGDKLIPKEVILNQTSLAAVSQVEILQESGHLGMIEETAKTAQIINSFLAI